MYSSINPIDGQSPFPCRGIWISVISALRGILASRGVARVWRFTWRCDEFDDDDLVGYELELPLITPDIGWDSWTSPQLDWVIHVRQAGRAAMIGGWLSKAVTSRWPSWRDHMA